MSRRALALPTALLLAAVVFTACSAEEPPPPQPPYRAATVEEFQALVADHPGVLAVAVMTAGCSPCVKELPLVNALHKELRGQGFEVVGLSLDYDRDGLEYMLEKTGIEFPVYWTGEAAIEALGIEYLPLIILVRDGQEVERIEGLHDEAELRAEFAALLDGS